MRLSRRMAAGTGAPGDGRFACLKARGGNRSPVSPRADLIAAPLAPPNQQVLPLLEQNSQWTDEMVASAGVTVHDIPFISVGGGMGSFITVDYLRVAGGVPAEDIRVLSSISHP